jgi:uncharacterized protein (TIGR02145 family)
VNRIKLIIYLIISACLIQSCKKDDIPELPPVEYGSMSDIEGNTYKTVKIGDQWWMAENLKTAKCNDGTAIPLVTGSEWFWLSTPGYCKYNNNQATYGNTYRALYNWYTVNTGKLCPSGWHVPSDAEWTTLVTYLGGESVAGGKMKETGTAHWKSPNTGATNKSGFSGLPGGDRDITGVFNLIGEIGFWWSSTESSSSPANAWSRFLGYDYTAISRCDYNRGAGFSVRCVRDN